MRDDEVDVGGLSASITMHDREQAVSRYLSGLDARAVLLFLGDLYDRAV